MTSIQDSKKAIAPITATSRLNSDYKNLMKDPIPYIVAEPLASNILECHYVITGPPDSPYAGGFYHGKLVFPEEFPFNPPSVYMITPNGRFQVQTKLCLSMSDYHPESWNPTWSVGTILTGLLSFMLENTSTQGSFKTSEGTKRRYAVDTHQFNLCDQHFVELFPDIAKKSREIISSHSEESNSKTLKSDGEGTIRADAMSDSSNQLEKTKILDGLPEPNNISKKKENAKKKLLADFENIQINPSDNFSAVPNETNVMIWNAVVFGPQDSPYEYGVFRLTLTFCDEYPYIPPQVQFTSKIFHPNVFSDGKVSPEILQNSWTPAIEVASILTTVRSILCNPSIRYEANLIASEMFQNNFEDYKKEVENCVEESWTNEDLVD